MSDDPRTMSRNTVEQIVLNSYRTEVLKGNQLQSSGWVKGPGMLTLLSVAKGRLILVTKQQGDEQKMISHVRAARWKGTKKILIWPCTADDPEAIPVTGSEQNTINLFSILGPEKLTVQTGYRERYAIEVAGEDSPVQHAIVMDMSRILDRRTCGKRRKAAAIAASSNTAAADDPTSL